MVTDGVQARSDASNLDRRRRVLAHDGGMVVIHDDLLAVREHRDKSRQLPVPEAVVQDSQEGAVVRLPVGVRPREQCEGIFQFGAARSRRDCRERRFSAVGLRWQPLHP